ncbi:uncharacterized protein F5891DRAFT_1244629 [Suillus fuscotomentosus]|uniref:Uncharacterized protein n=1 Tax=Suillus fuscotomentosus TaxID=1912939 RepID=A0AAD4HRI6_9AGAM|nr:uncharacterized protein F5891DRAFT_1244629 [Suillus fuscotomentosus]KAG1906358.1 hypothetical protein F5891DRAFT_1244629 [Suillus fuscotomentosus]
MLSTIGSPDSDSDSAVGISASDLDSLPDDLILEDTFRQVAKLDPIDFDQCRDVLKFLTEPNPEQESAEFSDVHYGVYWTVEHIIEENDTVPGRPRLSYFEDEHILLVEKFNSIHEVPFLHLDSIFRHFMYDLEHCDSGYSVDITVSRVLTLISASAVPDLSVEMNVVTWNKWIQKVLVVGECSFAQDTDSVLRKIKYEITSRPEVLMVIMVDNLSRSSFLSLQGVAAQSLDQPVVVAGHTWCHLASVQFHVWVRGDEPINIDVDNELLARGTLLPKQDMDAVDTMIEKGMVMMRDYLATVCQKVAPDSNISAIRDSGVTFCPNWNHLLRDLEHAVDGTAYNRYHSWYKSSL